MNKNNLKRQLIADEGVKYEVYLDHLGYKTFGIGHLVTESDKEWGMPVGTSVSKERVDQCFEVDVEKYIKGCEDLYGASFFEWPDEVQEVLVNMMFNLGKAGLGKFKKFRASLEANNWKEAANQGRESLWYKQVRGRAERLMRRLEALA